MAEAFAVPANDLTALAVSLPSAEVLSVAMAAALIVAAVLVPALIRGERRHAPAHR